MNGRAALDATVAERDLMATVVDVARRYGWLVYHTHDSRRSEAGFPDLVLVREDELLFWELKRENGRISPAQETWLAALSETGLEARVIRPSDLNGAIDRLKPKAAA